MSEEDSLETQLSAAIQELKRKRARLNARILEEWLASIFEEWDKSFLAAADRLIREAEDNRQSMTNHIQTTLDPATMNRTYLKNQFYWVRPDPDDIQPGHPEWEPAQWSGEYWFLAGELTGYRTEALAEIGLPCVREAVSDPGVITPDYRPCVGHQENLTTILRAAGDGNLALMECTLRSTGERVAVLTAMARSRKEVAATPLAVLLNGNPYELLESPVEADERKEAEAP